MEKPCRERSRHCQGGYCLGLSFLANKNTKHPLNFEFQINNKEIFYNKCIPCNIWDIHIVKSSLLFVWNAKLTGSPVFYLQLDTWSSGTEKSYDICLGIEPFIPFPRRPKIMFPTGHSFSKLFCITHVGLEKFPLHSTVRSEAYGEGLSSRSFMRLIGGSSD